MSVRNIVLFEELKVGDKFKVGDKIHKKIKTPKVAPEDFLLHSKTRPINAENLEPGEAGLIYYSFGSTQLVEVGKKVMARINGKVPAGKKHRVWIRNLSELFRDANKQLVNASDCALIEIKFVKDMQARRMKIFEEHKDKQSPVPFGLLGPGAWFIWYKDGVVGFCMKCSLAKSFVDIDGITSDGSFFAMDSDTSVYPLAKPDADEAAHVKDKTMSFVELMPGEIFMCPDKNNVFGTFVVAKPLFKHDPNCIGLDGSPMNFDKTQEVVLLTKFYY